MATPREALFVALLAKLTTLIDADDPDAGILKTASRVLLSWDDCPPGDCPAAFLVADGERRTTARGMPSLVRIDARILVYCKNDHGRETVPATQLNAVLSGIEDALQRQPAEGPAPVPLFPQNPDMTFGTTLGGLCYSCSIGETVDIVEGFQGADAVAAIPVVMWTTDKAALP